MKSSKNWKRVQHKTSVGGSIVYPHVHDGLLIGINLSNNDTCLLTVKTERGELVRIHLRKTAHLSVNNFMEGNIILDVTIGPPQYATEESLLPFIEKPNSSLEDRFNAQLLQKIKSKKLQLVELNPSYGCQLTALCETVECYVNSGNV